MFTEQINCITHKKKASPRGRRDDMPPPPADGSSIQKSQRLYVRPHSAHPWWLAVAKLQAASVPVA